jgi:putative membrane protein
MFLLFLLLVAGTLFYLLRTGRISAPPWMAAPTSPELEARKVLADRFARGDIGSDEFMERASVLNWTPGVQPEKSKSKRR